MKNKVHYVTLRELAEGWAWKCLDEVIFAYIRSAFILVAWRFAVLRFGVPVLSYWDIFWMYWGIFAVSRLFKK